MHLTAVVKSLPQVVGLSFLALGCGTESSSMPSEDAASGATGGAPPTGGLGATGGGATGGASGFGASGSGGTGAASGTGGTGGEPPVELPSVVTSGQDSFWQPGTVTQVTAAPDVSLDPNATYQDWVGFGGTFNEAGWEVLLLLSPSERDRAMRLLFDPNEGTRFTWGRVPVGSSDYGLVRYTLDEVPGDYSMARFSIERDREYLIPYIRAAQALNPTLRFWASPWTPPPWMKDNNDYDAGNMLNDPETLGAHALYLARFVEEYANEGINIEAIYPQNEPGWPQDYPSCAWTIEQMTDYIGNYLGPLFAQRLPTTEIWLGTISNPINDPMVYSVMGDATASAYITGIGLQWGMDYYAAQYIADFGLPLMQTEHRCGNYPWEGADQTRAPNDYAYAVESWILIHRWLEAGANSYFAWNMVLDTVGLNLDVVRPWAQNALLTVERSTNTLIVTPAYYVFRHFSGFIDPGAVRISTAGSIGNVLAFQNPDGSVVTVMHNPGDTPRPTTVGWGATTVEFEVPAVGWATVDWPPA